MDAHQKDRRPTAPRPAPRNKLSEEERRAVLDACNSQAFESLPPSQIVPRLADQGRYLASEASFYRILRAEGQQHHRGRAKSPARRQPPTSHRARGPCEVWSWDITWMPGPIRGVFFYTCRLSRKSVFALAKRPAPDSTGWMIRPGFLDTASRQDLIELARDGSAAHRLARRANALVLLDDGMSCAAVAKVLLLDDDTIRSWHRLYEEEGIEGLASFGYEGSACRLSEAQQDRLKAWITETLPRTTREVGAWIETECGIAYQGRSGLIALLHRLGMEHRKPQSVSRKLDPDKQAGFIKAYEDLLNHLADDEAALFGDAVHPTHAVRPVDAGHREASRSPWRRPVGGNA